MIYMSCILFYEWWKWILRIAWQLRQIVNAFMGLLYGLDAYCCHPCCLAVAPHEMNVFQWAGFNLINPLVMVVESSLWCFKIVIRLTTQHTKDKWMSSSASWEFGSGFSNRESSDHFRSFADHFGSIFSIDPKWSAHGSRSVWSEIDPNDPKYQRLGSSFYQGNS